MSLIDRAVAIVVDDNRLLVIYRDNHATGRKYYTLPGGGIEPGESPPQATLRELKEETGLDVELGRQVYEHRYQNGQKQYYYLCGYQGGEPALAEDSVEKLAEATGNFYKPMWLEIKKLPSTLLFPLEIRDWLVEDLKNGFPQEARVANLDTRRLRQSFGENTNSLG
ncbi:MAG: hypothetical protein JWO96_773 [Candidatus Saccharibacteria bacterium]|nr:hypothetical protein [Candidatus Saccharibacteria bacterium]